MTYQRVEIPAKNVREITNLFGYKKRKVCIVATESVTLSGLNWSGGSRSVYTPIRLDNFQVDASKAEELGRPAPWVNPYAGMEVPLRDGYAIVKTGHFCGQTATMTIYVHPNNMPMLINLTEGPK